MTANGAKRIWLLVVIVALGLALRLYRLGALGLTGNEDYLAIAVSKILATGVPEFPSGVVYPRALPLSYLTAALVYLLGFSELALRLPAVLFSTASIAGVYLLGGRLISREVALLGALLMAVSDWEVDIARDARMYSMLSAGCVYSLWLFHRATTEGGRWNLGALAALSAVTAWVHQIGFALGMMFASYALQFKPNRRRVVVWGVAIAVVVVSAGAYYAVNRHEYGGWDRAVEVARGEAWADAPDAGGDRAEAFTSRYLGPFLALGELSPAAFGVWTAMAAAALAWALTLAVRRPDRRLLATAAAAVVLAVFFHQLTLAAMALAAYALVGRRLEPDRYRSRTLRLLVPLAIAGSGWLGFGLWLSTRTSSAVDAILKGAVKPLIGYPPNFPRLFFEYFPLMAILAGIAGVVAIGRYLRDGRVDGLAAMVLLYGIPALVLGFHPASIGRTQIRYVSFLNPYFLLLVAFGAIWLASRLWRALAGARGLRIAAVALYALVLVVATDFAGLEGSIARVSARYGLNESVRDYRTLDGYFHPDLAGGALHVSRGYRAGDAVIATDILGFYAYFPHADYQLTLFGKPDAEGWLGGRSITSLDELTRTLDRHADGTVWIALSGAHRRRLRDDPRFEAILRLIEERAGEPVYRGRDGLSDVYAVPPAATS